MLRASEIAGPCDSMIPQDTLFAVKSFRYSPSTFIVLNSEAMPLLQQQADSASLFAEVLFLLWRLGNMICSTDLEMSVGDITTRKRKSGFK